MSIRIAGFNLHVLNTNMENMHSFTNLSLNKDKFFPLTRIVKNSNHTDGWEIKGKTNINHLSLCNKKNNRGINPSKWYSLRALPHRATVCHVSVLFYSGFSFNLSPVFMFECFFSFMDLVSDVKVWRFSLCVCCCVTGLMVAAGHWPPFPPPDMEPTHPAPQSL